MLDVSDLRGLRHGSGNRLTGLLVAAVLVAGWWLAAWSVADPSGRSSPLLPSPADVFEAIPRLSVFAGPGTPQTFGNAFWVLLVNTVASATTLFGGLLCGGALGIGLGLVLGWNARLRRMFEGPFLVVRVIPLFALLPLFLSWFGGARIGSVSFVAFAVFSMLFVNTLEAIRNVDPVARVFARTLGASPLRVYRTVVIPAIVPELAGGLRVVLGLAWAILLAAEFLAAQSGIGRIMILAQQYFDLSRMILIVLLIMLYTYALDQVVSVCVARITRWVPRI